MPSFRFLALVSTLGIFLASPFAVAGKKTNLQLHLEQINQAFRSSSQNIAADVLLSEAVPKLSKKQRQALAQATPRKILEAVDQCHTCKPNQGMVETLIRLHLLLESCQTLCLDLPINELVAEKFRALQPERFLARYTPADKAQKLVGEFNYTEYLMAKKAMISALNNDLYNFKMAGTYFAEGMHTSHQSTFRLFSRGHENRNYIIVAGIEQALDLLEGLRFSEYEVAVLEKNPEFQNLPKGFFKYLREFKFSGSVRAVKTGTVVFKDEPILEITGNPVDVTIMETLLIQWVNKMSLFTTKAVRVAENAGGRILSEGGSRRSTDAFASSLAGLLAGFKGTSNVEVADLTGTLPLGTEAHQYLGHFHPDEVRAHAIYRKYFPNTTLLVDTYDILSGVRAALISSGLKFKGIRLDSTIPGIHSDPTEAKRLTVLMVQELLQDLGYEANTYTITYSDGLTEKSLKHLTDRKAPFQIALVGTEIAAASDVSHLNSVYKVVEIINKRTGEVTYPIKLATGKVLQPGRSQVWRELDENGHIKRDILALLGENLNFSAGKNFFPLLHEMMEKGKKLFARENLATQVERIKSSVATLPAQFRQLESLPESEKFKFETSPQALEVQTQARAKALGVNQSKMGVVFMSGDPIHDEHELMIRRARNTFKLNRVILVLTGEDRVHKEGATRFSNKQRLEMALRRFPQDEIAKHGVFIWTGEMEGRTRRSIDTLDDIKAKLPEVAKASLYMIAGTDVFQTLPTWKSADRLANEMNWIVVQRKGHEFDFSQLNTPLFAKFKRLDDHAVLDGPQGNRIVLYDAKIPENSSTEIFNRIKKVEYIFHEVDAQLTFWEGMHGMTDGPLAVSGSRDITMNVAMLKWMAKHTANVKSTASADEHHDVEVRHAHINGEFHPSPDGSFPGFPPHAMAKVWGSVGDARIPEVQLFDPKNVLEIKHQKPVGEGLELIPFNIDANIDRILDPKYEILFRKNGNDSNSVWMNPYFEKVYDILKPKTVFVYGVATDFCVFQCVKGAAEKKYNVVLVTDGIAGVFDELTRVRLEEMRKMGVKFMTTNEVIKAFGYDREFVLKNAQKEVLNSLRRVKSERSMCRSMFGG